MIPPAKIEKTPNAASGEWTAGGRPGLPRNWAPGWDRGASCPPDMLDGAPAGGWRYIGRLASEKYGQRWRDSHGRRMSVVRLLRRSGYVARHRWAIGADTPDPLVELSSDSAPIARYLDGPAKGCAARDPWAIAKAVSACGSGWWIDPLVVQPAGGAFDLDARAHPTLCGIHHVCPVCAARESAEIGAALRDIIEDETGKKKSGPLALVTLTQRAAPGESLAAALDRLRRAFARMTTGRPGKQWKQYVASWYYGIEVTRGADRDLPVLQNGLPPLGAWWHVHIHVMIRIRPRENAETDAAKWIGERWQAVSGAAAVEVDRPGYGWDPVAGGVFGANWTGGSWWKSVPASNLAKVYQACKYAGDCALFHPIALAEYLAVVHGRRWHDGGGAWRGPRERAKALHPPDLVEGISFAVGSARERVFLDRVAPSLGKLDDSGRIAHRADPECVWRLSAAAPVNAIAAAIERIPRAHLWQNAGFDPNHPEDKRFAIGVPASAIGRLVRAWHERARVEALVEAQARPADTP